MISYSIITPAEITDIIGQIQGSFYSDGENLVARINQAIVSTVETQKNFSVFIEVRAPGVDINMPPEIMFLHQEFRGRGFFTSYKIIVDEPQTPDEEPNKVGMFTVSWANPDMGIYEVKARPYWNLTLMDMIGTGGKAYEYYLCLTGGVDLRRYTQNDIVYDIRKKLTAAALQSHRVISYSGPDGIFNTTTESGNTQLEAAAAVANLYAEAVDFLTENEYTVVDSTIPWTISS